MYMFDWSALMTPSEVHPGKLAYTLVIAILSTSTVASKFQHYLSVDTLVIYLCDCY
jgi:hypothetical protein